MIRALATPSSRQLPSVSYFLCESLPVPPLLTELLPLLSVDFPDSSVSKESSCSAGDQGSVPGSGRFPGEGNGNPLQYPGLENYMDRRAWQAAVHGVPKSWARLTDFLFTFTCPHLEQSS